MLVATIFRRNLQFLCLLFFLSSAGAAAANELQTLLSIKSALHESNTKVFDSWESTNPMCNFSGITCDSNNAVIEIELSRQNLTGSIPLDSICRLKSLETLSLGFNFLFGPVTDELNMCVSLRYLDLGNNFFSGSFPAIPLLSGLIYLHANRSGFSGTFPWDSLENMTNLIVLSLGDNPFDRTPFPSAILKLTKLKWLYLSNCSIEGKIPDGIGNLVELMNLELAQNYITGEIPVGISRLRNLWQLELYQNELIGKLPTGLGSLSSLEYFDASNNHLTGNLSEVRSLRQLVSLQVFKNEFYGEIPPELGEFEKLVNFSIYKNRLSGELPEKLGSWSAFHFIDASENYFTGRIPPDMCKKGTMKKLLILQNNFTGQIPATYANCKSLTRFRVSKNLLSGEVPGGIWGLPNAELIDIAENNLEGPITSDIGNAKSLSSLLLAKNRFTGELPSDISKASALVSIDLSYNQFTGNIPTTIGELKQLNSLQLQANKLSGLIPDSLGSCDSITDINMAHNFLTGQIPASLGSLPTLNYLNLSWNELSGSIPGSLSSLSLSLLDLSSNQLIGRIPESLSIEAYNDSFAGNNGLCSDKIRKFHPCLSEAGTSRHLRTVLFCFMVGFIVILLIAGFFCIKKMRKTEHGVSLKEDSWNVKPYHVLSFTEDEILDSIKQENIIGKGGSGHVYRVALENGIELAVKHIWHSNNTGNWKKIRSTTPMLANCGIRSREFEAEIQTLSSIRHINVVKLYCSITSEDSSLLVYEYMPNGSLWDRLHTCRKLALDWDTRYEIAVGAAKGLEYLHHGCDRPVIHRDVKSSNILLDEDLKPRIADFGLAKIVQENSKKESSTQIIAGTHGYIAPEYGYTNKVNEKSDLYSFGVVLMELVTGKRPVESEFGENKDIVDWVYGKLKSKGSVLSIVDSSIPQVQKEDAIKVLKIAILCTARVPALRPSMRTVVQMLEEAGPCQLVGIIVGKDGQK
ncbi:receptor kinase HAIKU2 [Olea europaea subsp. europaea]|uniref:non-specific serine/threonine protein kinase n=1 Tax=Olea europaea subsp. europaea TaxID=158383 RepID=A0A8S0SRF3_OLEEU|nr:receptor kinase HAIKU2 [Olea europaea subsp. europaea]